MAITYKFYSDAAHTTEVSGITIARSTTNTVTVYVAITASGDIGKIDTVNLSTGLSSCCSYLSGSVEKITATTFNVNLQFAGKDYDAEKIVISGNAKVSFTLAAATSIVQLPIDTVMVISPTLSCPTPISKCTGYKRRLEFLVAKPTPSTSTTAKYTVSRITGSLISDADCIPELYSEYKSFNVNSNYYSIDLKFEETDNSSDANITLALGAYISVSAHDDYLAASYSKTLGETTIKAYVLTPLGVPTLKDEYKSITFDKQEHQYNLVSYYSYPDTFIPGACNYTSDKGCDAGSYTSTISVKDDNQIYYCLAGVDGADKQDKFSETYPWEITVKPISKASCTISPKEYIFDTNSGGAPLSRLPTISYNTSYVGITGEGTVKKSDAGEYKVTFTLSDTKNTIWDDNTVAPYTDSWFIKPKPSEVVPSNASIPYDGQKHTIAIPAEAHFSYADTDPEYGPDAKEYTVAFKLNKNYAWAVDSSTDNKSAKLTITPAEISVPTVTTPSFTYEREKVGEVIQAKTHTLQISPEPGSSSLWSASGYSASAACDGNAYTCTFKLEDSKNYVWKKSDGTTTTANQTYSWGIAYRKITKASIKTADKQIPYDGKSHTPRIDNDDPLYITITGLTEQTSIATYTVTFSLQDDSSCYWNTSPASSAAYTDTWKIYASNKNIVTELLPYQGDCNYGIDINAITKKPVAKQGGDVRLSWDKDAAYENWTTDYASLKIKVTSDSGTTIYAIAPEIEGAYLRGDIQEFTVIAKKKSNSFTTFAQAASTKYPVESTIAMCSAPSGNDIYGEAVKYSIDDWATSSTSIPTFPKNTSPTSFRLHYKVEDSTYVKGIAAITILPEIKQGDQSYATVPEYYTSLTYTGSAQSVIKKAGVAAKEPDSATVKYKITKITSGSETVVVDWTVAANAKIKDKGNYKVYSKIIETTNYSGCELSTSTSIKMAEKSQHWKLSPASLKNSSANTTYTLNIVADDTGKLELPSNRTISASASSIATIQVDPSDDKKIYVTTSANYGRSDTITITCIDKSSVYDEAVETCQLSIINCFSNNKLWDGTAWKDAYPHIWDGSEWKKAELYIWDGSTWKQMNNKQ